MQPSYARARQPKTARYDSQTIEAILDAGLVAHVGFVDADRPMVMPMAYARIGRSIYLHGASKTRIARLDAVPVCVTVTSLTGIVAARSGFSHSMNHRSAVLHGTARLVRGAEVDRALDAITDHLLPGRTGEVRPMTALERKATGVVAIDVEHASAKVRTGPPNDDAADISRGVWGGVLQIETRLVAAIPDDHAPADASEPASFAAARAKFAL